MSDFIATEFVEPQYFGRAPDLQARLYKPIGISAVVAALDVMSKPVAPKYDATLDKRHIPAILQSEKSRILRRAAYGKSAATTCRCRRSGGR